MRAEVPARARKSRAIWAMASRRLPARGYAFTGDGTFGGLLAASTWPTTNGGPNGIRTRD
ncbi:MAG TPA: hypothetical protein VIJ73_17130 [Methylomirabilota bacterium]